MQTNQIGLLARETGHIVLLNVVNFKRAINNSHQGTII